MDKRLQLLETFPAFGDDGQRYVVHGFEHLVRLDGALDHLDRWEPTGQAEYKLASGEHIVVESTGGNEGRAHGSQAHACDFIQGLRWRWRHPGCTCRPPATAFESAVRPELVLRDPSAPGQLVATPTVDLRPDIAREVTRVRPFLKSGL